jgi:hypothetical protein
MECTAARDLAQVHLDEAHEFAASASVVIPARGNEDPGCATEGNEGKCSRHQVGAKKTAAAGVTWLPRKWPDASIAKIWRAAPHAVCDTRSRRP